MRAGVIGNIILPQFRDITDLHYYESGGKSCKEARVRKRITFRSLITHQTVYFYYLHYYVPMS